MKSITLTDLDGVHFQSRSECPPNANLIPAAVNSCYRNSSFMTEKQFALLTWLLTESQVVPVTARTVESFKRVLVDFKGYAICSFGGVILCPDGTPEPGWSRIIAEESALYCDALHGLKDYLEQFAIDHGIQLEVTVINDCGWDLYLNCKHSQKNESELALVASALKLRLPPFWDMHLNGNNLAALPPFLGKDKAVVYFLSELVAEHSYVLGLGDSFTDLSFLELCDYVAVPTNSQIFKALYRQ